MQVSAEALGPGGAGELFEAGADEVLMPCIGSLEDAAARAARVTGGPVTLHVPANRVAGHGHAADLLLQHGITRALVVSGNPGHGRGDVTIYQLIPHLRAHGIHVSVGAYPETYFSATGARHRARSAGILVDKQAVGAQRVITQASFSVSNMRRWLQIVRSRGVTVPIHVGVMAPVPRNTLRATMANARAEIFTHPRARAASKEDLDLLFRMLRSKMPNPIHFITAVGELNEMQPTDGFHIFSYGADVRRMAAAARAAGTRTPADGETAGSGP